MTVGDVDRERAKPGLTGAPETVEPSPGDTPERMAGLIERFRRGTGPVAV
jgi:hypothetical protein